MRARIAAVIAERSKVWAGSVAKGAAVLSRVRGADEKVAVDAHIETVMAGVTVTKPGEAFDPALLKDATILGE